MEIIQNIPELRSSIQRVRATGRPISFVPTMGNLHSGHLALIEASRAFGGYTVVSIFVNPFQFGAGEDFGSYPRTMEEDRKKIIEIGTDLLFTPTVDDLYPDGLDAITRVEVPDMGKILCGKSRPTFFRGITTVVSILFHLVEPTWAFFGEKDYQQLLIIRRMVSDLRIPVTILSVPTVREPDGLAMSSRNGYLSPEERSCAPALYKALCAARDSIAAGNSDVGSIEADGVEAMAAAGLRPDYFQVRRAADLALPEPADFAGEKPALRVLAAACLGRTRLIDNVGMQETWI